MRVINIDEAMAKLKRMNIKVPIAIYDFMVGWNACALEARRGTEGKHMPVGDNPRPLLIRFYEYLVNAHVIRKDYIDLPSWTRFTDNFVTTNYNTRPRAEERPPLGLIPKEIHEHNSAVARYREVCDAMVRYHEAGKQIPSSWLDEYNDLLHEINKHDMQYKDK